MDSANRRPDVPSAHLKSRFQKSETLCSQNRIQTPETRVGSRAGMGLGSGANAAYIHLGLRSWISKCVTIRVVRDDRLFPVIFPLAMAYS